MIGTDRLHFHRLQDGEESHSHEGGGIRHEHLDWGYVGYDVVSRAERLQDQRRQGYATVQAAREAIPESTEDERLRDKVVVAALAWRYAATHQMVIDELNARLQLLKAATELHKHRS